MQIERIDARSFCAGSELATEDTECTEKAASARSVSSVLSVAGSDRATVL